MSALTQSIIFNLRQFSFVVACLCGLSITVNANPLLVADIATLPGVHDSYPSQFTEVNGVVFFAAQSSSTGRELWATDGVNTWQVKDIFAGPDSSDPDELTVFGGELYFIANDGISGSELWKSDGTISGTLRVKDINAGSGDGFIFYNVNLLVVGNTLYFNGDERDGNGTELWKSDGTESGTVLVRRNINSYGFAALGNTLYFTAYDPVYGWELWKSDGTAQGTKMVKDIYVGGSSAPGSLTVMGDTLYFSASDGEHGIELWKSDGTEAGTQLVKDIYTGANNSGPGSLTVVNGVLYFRAINNGKEGLWGSDGTGPGTVFVKDIAVRELAALGNTLFIVGADVEGRLWRSDGTGAGTQPVFDLGSSMLGALAAIGDTLYFGFDDGVAGREPWQYFYSEPSNTGEMGDYIWDDLNTNGIQDSNESGLSNVTVDLLRCNGSVVDTTTTATDGRFHFTQIGTGSYQMRYHLPTGYRFSPANQGNDYTKDSNVNLLTGLTPCLSMVAGQQRLAIDAGMTLDTTLGIGTSVIGDFIWDDSNGNGIQESYETGLANITVDLMSCSGSVLASTTADSTGQYRFAQLAAGAYQIKYHLPTGYRYSSAGRGGDYRKDSNVSNTTGLSPCLIMSDGQQRLAIDVGMVPDSAGGAGNIGDYVWDDLNSDGVQDSNEPGLANVIVDLQSCNGTLLESTATDAAGNFLFNQLAVGDYQMYFHLPAGYRYSPAGRGGSYRTDSNVNHTTGLSPCLTIDGHQRTAVDAGMMQ